MIRNSFTRAGVGLAVSSALFLGACSGGEEVVLTPKEQALNLIAKAKKDISAKKYSEAQQKCEKAEKLDKTNPEAPYCVIAANMGAMVQSLSSIISLVASQFSPSYQASAIDGKSILGAVLSDIEGQMAYIDLYAYKLSEFENPTFQIDDFVLALDPADILELTSDANSEIKINGELALNLKGTWDISEVAALGAAINGVQGILDYLLAHSLVIDSTDFGSGTEGVAQFIADNKKLLIKDAADTGRITGDDAHKGIKKDFLAALSYAVGRAETMEQVAPANGGLVAAIKQSAANNAADAVVKFTDADGDGIPEMIAIPALADLKTAVTGIEIETEFKNPLSTKTWLEIIKVGEGVRDNIEGSKKAVSLKAALDGVVGDLKPDHLETRILLKAVPNLLALNPANFLEKPKYVRELIPYYFNVTTNPTNNVKTYKAFDLAFEKEMYASPYNKLERIGLTDMVTSATNDYAHFHYAFAGTEQVTAGIVVSLFTFDEFTGLDKASLEIPADSVKASIKSPELYYIALRDPSLGGMLEVNSAWLANNASVESTFAAADNATFNKGLNSLIKYYCLNTTITDAAGDIDFLGIFDDANPAYASNKMATCLP